MKIIRCSQCGGAAIDRYPYTYTIRMKDGRVFFQKICQNCNQFVLVHALDEDFNRSNVIPREKNKQNV